MLVQKNNRLQSEANSEGKKNGLRDKCTSVIIIIAPMKNLFICKEL